MSFPTPHFDKLRATLDNEKLPAVDVPRIGAAIERYKTWISELTAVTGTPHEILNQSVDLLSTYAGYIYVDLVFDSPEDFLYRQKGQLKLDNSIIEEFLPWITRSAVVPEMTPEFEAGPMKCYSAAYFESSLSNIMPGGGLHIRTKNQDFAIAKKAFIKTSHNQDFTFSNTSSTHIAYVATEIKTNLDKTMFQEACATARDLRMAVPQAKYYLMAEWLDMAPVSTAPTDIEQVILLRRAKRINSNMRNEFSTHAGRMRRRSFYVDYLNSHPFDASMFHHWINHLRALFRDTVPEETSVLSQGYF